MKVTKDTSFKNLVDQPIPSVADRPCCAGCGLPRKVQTFKSIGENEWHYTGYGYFCTLRCATDWANAKMAEMVHKIR